MGQSPKNCCVFIVYAHNNNLKNTKKALRNNKVLTLSAYKRKTKKENLLLTHSHFLPALEEAKNIARRYFRTYFENDKLNTVAANVITEYNML